MKQDQRKKSYHNLTEGRYYETLLQQRFKDTGQVVSRIRTGHLTPSENEVVHSDNEYIVVDHSSNGLTCVNLDRLGSMKPQMVQLATQWFPMREQIDFNTWLIKTHKCDLSRLITILSTESILAWEGGRCYHDLNIKKKERIKKKKVKTKR